MKRLVSIALSLGILGVIYWKIDARRLLEVFRNSDGLWMGISLGMVVPLTMLTSWRLQQLLPRRGRLGFGEANRLTLMASVLNMVLPSKMGDIAKAYFIKEREHLDGSLALALVVFEKACDMLALLLWCAFGLAVYPRKDAVFWVLTAGVAGGLVLGLLLLGSRSVAGLGFGIVRRILPWSLALRMERLEQSWGRMHEYFWSDRARLLKVSATSIFLWFLHLLQIWFFILALHAWTPLLANLALAPLAILAGLLPLTFAGIGTRDAALILFYQPFLDAPTAAALGVLCTSRYVLPALGGLPFLGQHLAAVRGLRDQASAVAPAGESAARKAEP